MKQERHDVAGLNYFQVEEFPFCFGHEKTAVSSGGVAFLNSGLRHVFIETVEFVLLLFRRSRSQTVTKGNQIVWRPTQLSNVGPSHSAQDVQSMELVPAGSCFGHMG